MKQCLLGKKAGRHEGPVAYWHKHGCLCEQHAKLLYKDRYEEYRIQSGVEQMIEVAASAEKQNPLPEPPRRSTKNIKQRGRKKTPKHSRGPGRYSRR